MKNASPATKVFWQLVCDNGGCSGAEIFGTTESNDVSLDASCPRCGIPASRRRVVYCPLDRKQTQEDECPCFERGEDGWCRWNPEATDRCDYRALRGEQEDEG